MKNPLKVVIVGAGDRSNTYASYALDHPDEMQVIGVVEPNPARRAGAMEKFSIPEEMSFSSVEDFVKTEKVADAVINGTMDTLHVPTSIPLLRKGYDMLLEKPFAVNKEEMYQLAKVAKEENRKVMICHVLRYAPFYRKIKDIILSGEIGDVFHIEMTEHVCYHHMIHSYVRGKWASDKECGSPILLAKSCHDIDLMMWMMGEAKPEMVSSFSSQFQFTKDKKPARAGSRCLVDCPIEKDCVYSARRNYLNEHNRWQSAFADIERKDTNLFTTTGFSLEEKEEALRNTLDCGKCIWDCERDENPENQTVMIRFNNGATGTFSLVGGTPGAQRSIHVVGTKGEIIGVFDKSTYEIKKPMPEDVKGHVIETYDLKITGDMIGATGGHGGGDQLLVTDFVKYMQGEEPSVSCTALDKSLEGHLTVFRAEEARKTNQVLSVFEEE